MEKPGVSRRGRYDQASKTGGTVESLLDGASAMLERARQLAGQDREVMIAAAELIIDYLQDLADGVAPERHVQARLSVLPVLAADAA